jgi:hypothetical protein
VANCVSFNNFAPVNFDVDLCWLLWLGPGLRRVGAGCRCLDTQTGAVERWAAEPGMLTSRHAFALTAMLWGVPETVLFATGGAVRGKGCQSH